MIPGSPSLVEVLRSTLERLEQNEDLAADDPALAELKATILRAIAELEVGKTPKSSSQQRILWITPRPQPVAIAEPAQGEELDAAESDRERSEEEPLSAKAAARKSRARAGSTRRTG